MRNVVWFKPILRVHRSNKIKNLRTFLFYLYIILSFYETYLTKLIGPISKYYILLMMIIFLFTFEQVIIRHEHIFMFLWLLFKLISTFWALNSPHYYSIVIQEQILTHIGMVIFFFTMTSFNFEIIFLKKIINIILYTSVSMGFFGLFFSDAYRGDMEARQVLTLFGKQIDPNNLAVFYLIGIAIAGYIIIFENKNILRNSIFCAINSLSLIFTGSRGGFISLIIVILFFVFFPNRKKQNFARFSKKLIIIILLLTVLYYIVIIFSPMSSFNRIFNFDSYEGGSRRVELWNIAISMFVQKPLFGWGWGGYSFGIHNTFLTLFTETGFIGAILFLLPVSLILFKAIYYRQPLPIILLLVGIMPSFFIDAINKRFLWNSITISFMLINSMKQSRDFNPLKNELKYNGLYQKIMK